MTTRILFPNRLREYRKRADLTQTDVANALGLASPDRISHWEKGIALPNVINLFKLSILYETSSESLYEGLRDSLSKPEL